MVVGLADTHTVMRYIFGNPRLSRAAKWKTSRSNGPASLSPGHLILSSSQVAPSAESGDKV